MSPVREPVRPELIRSIEARLAPGDRCASATVAVKAGRHLLVADRLHRAATWAARCAAEPPAQRRATRPSLFGVTLMRVLPREGATIGVSGFDALDGSPILDVKPYQTLFETPS